MPNEIPPKLPVQAGQSWLATSLNLFARLTGWVAAPIVAALLIGGAIDKRFNTAPWAFISLTVIGFTVSTLGIVIEGKKAMKQFEKPDSEIKSENKDGGSDQLQ